MTLRWLLLLLFSLALAACMGGGTLPGADDDDAAVDDDDATNDDDDAANDDDDDANDDDDNANDDDDIADDDDVADDDDAADDDDVADDDDAADDDDVADDDDAAPDDDDAAPCSYPAGAVDPMALNQVLWPYSWPEAISPAGVNLPMDLELAPCANDPNIEWSTFDVLVFISLPVW